MPINITGQTRRWLDLGSVVHILYETDGDSHITLCRKLLRSGTIIHANMQQVKGMKCQACLKKIKRRGAEE